MPYQDTQEPRDLSLFQLLKLIKNMFTLQISCHGSKWNINNFNLYF